MKLVKYHAGNFDNTCTPKECPAIILSTKKMKVKDDKEIEVANLVIFQDNQPIAEHRVNVPHKKNALKGKDGESVHAYWEDIKEK